jgi:hypothetical protein
MALHLRIRRDVSGTWSVHGLSPVPASGLPSLSASVDYARKECAAAPATIELLIGQFYAVIRQEQGWPRRLVAAESYRPPPALEEADPRSPSLFSRFLLWLRGPHRSRSQISPGY